jgi:hypothetical protein
MKWIDFLGTSTPSSDPKNKEIVRHSYRGPKFDKRQEIKNHEQVNPPCVARPEQHGTAPGTTAVTQPEQNGSFLVLH